MWKNERKIKCDIGEVGGINLIKSKKEDRRGVIERMLSERYLKSEIKREIIDILIGIEIERKIDGDEMEKRMWIKRSLIFKLKDRELLRGLERLKEEERKGEKKIKRIIW